jgi:hypothetical protein
MNTNNNFSEDTTKTLQVVLGQTISALRLEEGTPRIFDSQYTYRHHCDSIVMEFGNGLKIRMFDAGQSCCERRYMRTDDDLPYYAGAKLLDVEIRDGLLGNTEDGDVHECQFLVLITDRGNISFSNHNEHNGYYGGFDVVALPFDKQE